MARNVFDQTVFDGEWIQQKINSADLEPVNVTKLKICTWNIWFANERQQIRMQNVMRIIEENDVDIFCFQEVTSSLLEHILSHSFVQKYYLSGITQEIIGSYGNVIFSRFQLSRVYVNDYEKTKMNRKLVAVDILVNNEIFRIGTVHLESMAPSAKLRVIQLNESMTFMVTAGPGIEGYLGVSWVRLRECIFPKIDLDVSAMHERYSSIKLQ